MKTDTPVSGLIERIKIEFEKNMDDDLGFGIAIDNIFKILLDLKKVKENSGLTIKNISQLKKIFQKIDSVAGVLF